jgi:hypothetical protein
MPVTGLWPNPPDLLISNFVAESLEGRPDGTSVRVIKNAPQRV